jgi:hypothetical protein
MVCIAVSRRIQRGKNDTGTQREREREREKERDRERVSPIEGLGK